MAHVRGEIVARPVEEDFDFVADERMCRRHARIAPSRGDRHRLGPLRRRAQGETLRELAVDYGVAHTTLGRFLARPDARATLKGTRVALRLEAKECCEVERVAAREEAAERRARRRVEDMDTTESPNTPADVEPPRALPDTVAAARSPTIDPPLRRWASEYANWLDDRDYARPLTRRDLWSTNDELAAEITAAGGGVALVIDVTGLKTEENVRRLIDAEIIGEADRNDALQTESSGLGSSATELVNRPS